MLARSPLRLLLGTLVLATTGLHAQTTHTVNLLATSFSPANLTIAQGDTVRWVWVTGVHDVTAANACFRSGAPVPPPATFQVTFDAAFLGTCGANGNRYDYFCSVHVGMGMTGSITVTSTGKPVLTATNVTAGQFATLRVAGVAPGSQVAMLFSADGPGPTTVSPGTCGPLTLQLTRPRMVGVATADAAGVAVLPMEIPGRVQGRRLWFQAVDVTGCQLSNAFTTVVR